MRDARRRGRRTTTSALAAKELCFPAMECNGEREGEATAYVQRNDFIFFIFNATAFALSRMERPCRRQSVSWSLTNSQPNAVTLTRTEVPRGKCPEVFCLEHAVVNKSKRGHARKCTRKSVFSTHGKLGERETPTCRAAC